MALASDPRGYCVCSSFGKDSMALIEVFKQAGVKFWVKWNITGVDPPELVYFARGQMKKLESQGVPVYMQMYGKSIAELISGNQTPPTRLYRYCCRELKEKRLKDHNTCFHSFGIRRAESNKRANRNELEIIANNPKNKLSIEYIPPERERERERERDFQEDEIFLNSDNDEKRRQFEYCAAKGVRAVNPIISWTDEYLWDFTKSENVPYCKLYDDGFDRLGCIGCPMASIKHRIYGFQRYPKFYNYYLIAFERMIESRKAKGVDERRLAEGKVCLDWSTPQKIMDWWLETESSNDLILTKP